MTTLPPEGQDGQPTGNPAADVPVPPAPSVPEQPAAVPQLPEPAAPPQAPPAAPVPPVAPPAPPAAPPVQPPQYTAPQTPPAPQYAAPQQPVQPPQYTAPPAAGQYQAPPPGGAQQPPLGYQQPIADPVSNISLNYWLSVFFTWIPALIFFLVEKDKGNPQSFAFHRENLNFSLLRVGVVIAGWILGMVPGIGGFLGLILWLGSVTLFVFHIIAAAKAPENYRRGQQPGFIFNIPLIK